MRINSKNIRKSVIIILIALVFIVGLYLLVSKTQFFVGTRFYITFHHIGSMPVGAVVRTAGVRIGSVTAIKINEVDRKSVIAEISLYPKEKVLKGSRFIIMSGSLLGDQYVEVIPADSTEFIQEGDHVQGDPIKNLDSFLLSSDTLIKDFTTSMSILSEILRDNKDNISTTLQNIRESSDAIKQYLVTADGGDPSVLERFARVMDGLDKITDSLASDDSVVSVLSSKKSSQDIEKTISNLQKISESLTVITRDLEIILEDIVPKNEKSN
ncbi:MAG: MCE family protein [Spirochaetales bacterium]|nr:MCE family protein [Spirochaetales bacterium]